MVRSPTHPTRACSVYLRFPHIHVSLLTFATYTRVLDFFTCFSTSLLGRFFLPHSLAYEPFCNRKRVVHLLLRLSTAHRDKRREWNVFESGTSQSQSETYVDVSNSGVLFIPIPVQTFPFANGLETIRERGASLSRRLPRLCTTGQDFLILRTPGFVQYLVDGFGHSPIQITSLRLIECKGTQIGYQFTRGSNDGFE